MLPQEKKTGMVDVLGNARAANKLYRGLSKALELTAGKYLRVKTKGT